MEYLKAFATLLISPLILFLILISISEVLRLGNKNRTSRWLFIVSTVFLFLSSQPLVANLLLFPLEFNEEYKKYALREKAEYDIIYVPACYYSSLGEIAEISRFHECSLQRLTQALIRLVDNPEATVILTGGDFGDDKILFAQKSKALLIRLGADPNKIVEINEGHNTQTEIDAAKDYFNNKRVLVVSSATHGIRLISMIEPYSKKLYFDPVDFNTPGLLYFELFPPSMSAMNAVNRALYEYLAILKYKIFTNELN